MHDQPITKLLASAARGDSGADDRLAEAVVAQLERIAHREMARRHGRLDGLTLEPQVFAHDALLRVLDASNRFENRRHFFAYATQIIIRALIDYQRARGAQKRGGGHWHLTLGAAAGAVETVDAAHMPAALEALEALDPRKSDVVRLRVFWGMTAKEIADVLETSVRTVERDWRFARRWLAAELAASASAEIPGDEAPEGQTCP